MDKTRNIFLERTFTVWGIVLIAWAIYRRYEQFPEWVDELLFKPLVFLGPMLFYVLFKERRPLSSIGLTGGKFFRDVYLGIGFGMLFAIEGIVVNAVKYGKFSFAPVIPVQGAYLALAVILSVVTAFSEELFARGFLFTRLKEGYASEMKALLISSAMYFLLLVPIIFTVTKLSGMTLFIFVVTNVVMSLANTMIFSETKTITVPVLIHAFWNMAVVLYL